MESLVVVALGVALFGLVTVLLVRAHRRVTSTPDNDSSDDETAEPLSVSVVLDHDEQDSLLPKFAGLLHSPLHSVTIRPKSPFKMMRPAWKESLSTSLTRPLPLGKRKKAPEVPVKKVHVPYFLPLLDETSKWWQSQQSADTEARLSPEQEPEGTMSSSSDWKKETHTPDLLRQQNSAALATSSL